eukprot:683445-Pelagomonas_calceolata.AAC.2
MARICEVWKGVGRPALHKVNAPSMFAGSATMGSSFSQALSPYNALPRRTTQPGSVFPPVAFAGGYSDAILLTYLPTYLPTYSPHSQVLEADASTAALTSVAAEEPPPRAPLTATWSNRHGRIRSRITMMARGAGLSWWWQ